MRRLGEVVCPVLTWGHTGWQLHASRFGPVGEGSALSDSDSRWDWASAPRGYFPPTPQVFWGYFWRGATGPWSLPRLFSVSPSRPGIWVRGYPLGPELPSTGCPVAPTSCPSCYCCSHFPIARLPSPKIPSPYSPLTYKVSLTPLWQVRYRELLGSLLYF